MATRPRGLAAFARLFRGGDARRPGLVAGEATPLATLPLLALDVETTGLDPRRDRLISFAGIPLRGLHGDGDPLDLLVHPGRAIPAGSTAVHGISDAMVADAPPYADVHAAVLAQLHGRVALGHTIGFDLAVIDAEARRAGLHFPVAASLCLAELAAAALPENAAVDLDSLVRLFGIEIAGRHTARGDAQAAADVWLRLLPLLQDRGIHTFGAARKAAAAARQILSMKRRSSW